MPPALAIFVLLGTLANAVEPPRKPALDLSNFHPTLDGPIVGSWSYVSPLDGLARTVVIDERAEAAYPFEGVEAEGESRVILRLARRPASPHYEGEIEPAFDRCFVERARIERATADPRKIEIDVVATVEQLVGGRDCNEPTYSLVSRTPGETVRLKPDAEARGGVQQSGDPRRAELSYTVDAPRVPDGSTVRVTARRTEDGAERWCRVELVDVEIDAEGKKVGGPRAGWVRADQVFARIRYTLERR